jgi:hypothetical protein
MVVHGGLVKLSLRIMINSPTYYPKMYQEKYKKWDKSYKMRTHVWKRVFLALREIIKNRVQSVPILGWRRNH